MREATRPGWPLAQAGGVFGYRRSSYRRAAGMLAVLRADPGNAETLYELQELLIAEITLAEGRVRDSKALAGSDAGRRSHFERRARAHQRSIYAWKAFGDAIAFLHCDRFALKHVYYNTHNLGARQDAGFISGSAGFAREFDVLRELLDAGIPSVLCDLTNTSRYGDVCVLAQDDPVLVEVKSSGTRDRRRARQAKRLKTLQEFYRSDVSRGLRGLPVVHRVAVGSEAVSLEDEFNACIEAAYRDGHAARTPEPGVRYVAIREAVDPAEAFRGLAMAEPWAFALNEAKRECAWAPHYPFTLLIRSERALYDFLLGRLLLYVLLDVAVVKDLARGLGWAAEFDAEADYPLQAWRGDGETVRLARGALARAAFEALSLKWVVEAGIGGFDDVMDRLAGDGAVAEAVAWPSGVEGIPDALLHRLPGGGPGSVRE